VSRPPRGGPEPTHNCRACGVRVPTEGFLNGLEGMSIGAVDPLVITDDTPIDYGQWDDGKPWHPLRPPDAGAPAP
jgi:hypothetical protein